MDCTSQLLQLKAGKVYSDSYFVMALALTTYGGFTTHSFPQWRYRGIMIINDHLKAMNTLL
jgi:hypothetical protein